MPGYYPIIASEFVCAVFMSITLLGLASVSKIEKRKISLFRIGVIATLFALIVDFLSYIAEMVRLSSALLYLLNTLSYLFGDAVTVFISAYIIAEIQERRKLAKGYFLVVVGLCVTDTIIILIGVVSGHLFSVSEGIVSYGPMNNLAGVIPVIILVYQECLILFNSRHLGKRASVILSSYQFLPFLSLALQLLLGSDVSYTYVTASFSNVLIYVMILSSEIQESHTKEHLIAEVSVLDMMTGLKNRNAFDKAISEVSPDEKIGIVHCDINALKAFNDANGVQAGNAKIMLVADLLKRSFENGTIYRVSGDGFFVLVKNARKVEFEGLVNTFTRKIYVNNYVAAVGSAYGHGKDVYRLISESETVMRADKLGFYQNRNTRGDLS